MPLEKQGFDYARYRRMLAEAVDEPRRLALIEVLIKERAMDRLAAHTAGDRAAMQAPIARERRTARS